MSGSRSAAVLYPAVSCCGYGTAVGILGGYFEEARRFLTLPSDVCFRALFYWRFAVRFSISDCYVVGSKDFLQTSKNPSFHFQHLTESLGASHVVFLSAQLPGAGYNSLMIIGSGLV